MVTWFAMCKYKQIKDLAHRSKCWTLNAVTMSNQRVLVTYAGPTSLLLSENWKQIYTALLSQLPLRNLHWSSSSRPSIRTIQELDIHLLSLEALHDERTSQIPVTILEKPLLNIFFVACEVSVFSYPLYT